MKYRLLLFVTILSATQFVYGQQSDLQTGVAKQVGRIKLLSGPSEWWSAEPPGRYTPEDNPPVQELIKYGIDAIPDLVPFLTDTSFTKAYRLLRNGRKDRTRVNEYIIFVINRITEHEFYLPAKQSRESIAAGAIADPGVPKDIKGLQDQINAWWSNNGGKTLLDRKINDVDDPVHPNRFSAYEWLGRTREESGRLALERRIDTLLTGEVNSLKQSEMAACAEALAKIGNTQSAKFVRKVCDHLAYWIYMSYRPVEEGRSGSGSMQLSDLFKTYHALSSLGFKHEALSHLRELETKYLGEMELSTQQEFRRNMENAMNW